MNNECTYKVFYNCPNCGTSEDNITVIETTWSGVHGSQVQCNVCKTTGPWNKNLADAIREWNDMPRDPNREEREEV